MIAIQVACVFVERMVEFERTLQVDSRKKCVLIAILRKMANLCSCPIRALAKLLLRVVCGLAGCCPNWKIIDCPTVGCLS